MRVEKAQTIRAGGDVELVGALEGFLERSKRNTRALELLDENVHFFRSQFVLKFCFRVREQVGSWLLVVLFCVGCL